MCFSCNSKTSTFKQPEVLKAGSIFDLERLSFNENLEQLVSKSLDSFNNHYSSSNYKPAIYPTQDQIIAVAVENRSVFLEEKRYNLTTVSIDSICQFFGAYTDYMAFEADLDFKMKTVWTSFKFYDTLNLDATLHKMYSTYGKTVDMIADEQARGLNEILLVHTDEAGNKTREYQYEKFDVDDEERLYEYKGDNLDFHEQWNLPDRIFQISISKGSEYKIDIASNEMKRVKYHELTCVFVLNQEYDLIKNRLISQSTAHNYPMRIVKPYYIKSLDFYYYFDKFLIEETADGKVYDFTR